MSLPSSKPAHVRLICLGLGLVTIALYLPALKHEFLLYDDQQYVTENRHVLTGLTWPGVVWAFKSFYASNWHPLTWLSHMLDCQWYGLHAWGHHLTNVLLHALASVLLFLALHRMTGAAWRSAAVAALFAWHPLHVESVAWIAERKDVLCGCFSMLTMLAYAKYVECSRADAQATASESRQPRSTGLYYLLTLFALACALMSKPMAVTLPFVLLLLDYWPFYRTPWLTAPTFGTARLSRLVVEKLPLLALSAACCVLTILAQAQSYSIVSTGGLPVARRIPHALAAVGHYGGDMFWPTRLAVYYPYPDETPVGLVLGGVLLVLALPTLAVMVRRQKPYVLVGCLWFLGTLVPVVGLVQVGNQAWADRYTYLPLIGLFVIIVWFGAEQIAKGSFWLQKRAVLKANAPRVGNFVPVRALALEIGVPVMAAAILMTVTSTQLRYWKDTRTLFQHAADVTQRNAKALTILASLLANEGKMDQAMALYATALSYKPDNPETHFSRANALVKQGKLDEAIADYRQALWFRPIQDETHILMGVALTRQKKYDEAAAHFQAALTLNPESAMAQNGLGKILHEQGKLDEAIQCYAAALKIEPELAPAQNNLGVILLQKGRMDEALAHLREAVRLRPDDVESQYNLAQALVHIQRWKEAAGIFSRIAPGRPDDANLSYQYGLALAHLGKIAQARSEFANALLQKSDFPDALNGLSWILATDPHPEFRNSEEAVNLAEMACGLTGHRNPQFLATLSAAYAEAGRFREAVATAQEAQNLANASGLKTLAATCQSFLENFQAGKPWRQ